MMLSHTLLEHSCTTAVINCAFHLFSTLHKIIGELYDDFETLKGLSGIMHHYGGYM